MAHRKSRTARPETTAECSFQELAQACMQVSARQTDVSYALQTVSGAELRGPDVQSAVITAGCPYPPASVRLPILEMSLPVPSAPGPTVPEPELTAQQQFDRTEWVRARLRAHFAAIAESEAGEKYFRATGGGRLGHMEAMWGTLSWEDQAAADAAVKRTQAASLEPLPGAGADKPRRFVDDRHLSHVALLEKVLTALRTNGKSAEGAIEDFLGRNRSLARTAITDYRAGRIPKRISEMKRTVIEAAIRETALKLGLTHSE